MPHHIIIRLGTRASGYGSCAPEGYQVIGDVRHGMAFGCLAIASDGKYVQVNGDIVQPLNDYKVKLALRKAERLQRAEQAKAEPVVIVRKRRRIVMPTAPKPMTEEMSA